MTMITCLTMTAAIGGLCQGYDGNIISIVSLVISEDYKDQLNQRQENLIVSIGLLGATIGSIISGSMSDRFGRRITIIMADIIIWIGVLISINPKFLELLVYGRFITGFGVSVATIVGNVYITEISPVMLRGSYATLNTVITTVGELLAILMGMYFERRWKLQLMLLMIPAFLQFFIFVFFMTESPHFLARTGKKKQAIKVVRKMFVLEEGFEEFVNEIENLSSFKHLQSSTRSRFLELRTKYKRNFMIGIGIQVAQQLCGVSSIIYYGPIILNYAGYGINGHYELLLWSVPIYLVNLIGTTISLIISSNLGGRYLMLRLLPFIALSMFLLSASFYFIHADQSRKLSEYAVMIMLLILVFNFAIGLNSQPGTLCTEIFPTDLRGMAYSITIACNWQMNYLVNSIFIALVSGSIWRVLIFFTFGIFSILTFMFVYNFVDETSEKPLDECVEMFREGESQEDYKLHDSGERRKFFLRKDTN